MAGTKEGIPRLVLRLWGKLERRRRRQFLVVGMLMLASAALEVVSLGAVLPFVAVLVDPEAALDYPLVGRLATWRGLEDPDDLILPLTIGFGGLAMVAGAVRLLVLRVSTRLSVSASADLSVEAYRRTLYQPYQVHVERNSSDVMSGILEKVETATRSVFQPVQTLGTSVLMVVAVIGTLVVISPAVALATLVVLGGCYAAVVFSVRRRIRENGQVVADEKTKLYRALQEGLGGIRDVLLGGLQDEYMRIYRSADAPLRRARSVNAFLSLAPRHLMEALAMVMVAVLAYTFSRDAAGVAGALPLLGAIAVGGQRLLPALQQGYFAWASIAATEAHLRETMDFLDQLVDERFEGPAPRPLGLGEGVTLSGVGFRYSDESPWVLRDVDLEIARGSRVAIVGPSGSGKSTLLDLLMGLLEPTVGRVEVDGRRVDGSTVRAWQGTIAHVPQHVFLTDASFVDNIVMGTSTTHVDLDRVNQVVRWARLREVVEAAEGGLDARVGERGVRLSGGQRQRIGIARALYRGADLLVLDEATSALDSVTEREVTEAITGGSQHRTVVLVAHRLSTVEDCDLIVELDEGRVVARGTYRELLERSPSFRRLARSPGDEDGASAP